MIIKKVLLATDFSEASVQLVNCLGEFLPVGLEQVLLLHVLKQPHREGTSLSLPQKEQDVLDSIQAKCTALGLAAQIMLASGDPAAEIVKTAQQERVGLIMVASQGKGRIKKLFAGSTSDEVIRTSPVPVLINRYQPIEPGADRVICGEILKKVLLPLDFSSHSLELLQAIPSIAPQITEVVLLTVIEGNFTTEELIRTVENRQTLINAAKSGLEALGLKVKTMVQQGPASTRILEVAEKENISLIMISKRGLSLIQELLLGSTTREVIRRSKQPVLLIPPALDINQP